MWKRVQQVQVFYDDEFGTAEEYANNFLKGLHEKSVVDVRHEIDYSENRNVPPRVSIIVRYREAIKDDIS